MGSFELSERARRILATLVREYIATGQPVPSQVLARKSGLGVSSATVRTVLGQLEELGYVHQPHTSAGRTPTDRGYRVFVDALLDSRRRTPPSPSVENELRQQVERSPLMDDMLASVSHLVARAARQVGFAFAGSESAVLQRLEFVALGGSRVLVVVVSAGNQISQKVIDSGEQMRPDDLVYAANYLNREFAGLPMPAVREAVLTRLAYDRMLYDQLLARTLRLARATLEEMPKAQALHVEGVASLLEAQEHVSLATLRALFEMMEEKERMVHLLNQYIDGPGLTVVIGEEHAAPGLRPFSLIASTAVDGNTVRTIGVIGPTRMDYQRAITLVDGTTQAVTRVLRNA